MGRTKCSEAGNLTLKRGVRNPCGSVKSLTKTGLDGLKEAPWRRTLSIFKQPVTLVHTTSKLAEKPPEDLIKRLAYHKPHRKFDVSEKPQQIFWAKAFEGLEAVILVSKSHNPSKLSEGQLIEEHLFLPPKTETILPLLSEYIASATLINVMHHNNEVDLTGQQATKKQIEDNPLSALMFSQPFVQISPITEQDVVLQERRVLAARKQLQELRNSHNVR